MADHFQVPRGIPIRPSYPQPNTQKRVATQDNHAFEDLLTHQLQESELKFSAHAEKRLRQRGLSLSSQQIDSLQSAVNKAAEKGSKESLVLVDDLAFVVSVRNRTVITALTGSQMEDNVFTNIDSAVISKRS